MESITEWLISKGFTENQGKACFQKGSIEIPFSSLSGRTVESFQKLAKEKGWLLEENSTVDWGGIVWSASQFLVGVSLTNINDDGM